MQLDIANINFIGIIRVCGDTEIVIALVDQAITKIAAQSGCDLAPVIAAII